MKIIKKRDAYETIDKSVFISIIFALIAICCLVISNLVDRKKNIGRTNAINVSKVYEPSYEETQVLSILPLITKRATIPEKFLVELEYEHNGKTLRETLNNKILYETTTIGDMIIVDIYEDLLGRTSLGYNSNKQ